MNLETPEKRSRGEVMKGKIYLIPTLLGEGKPEEMLPPYVLKIIREMRFFIVEEIRTARRFLSKVGIPQPIDSLTFFLLNEHIKSSDILLYLDPALTDNIGLMSEAGVPGVADPGADIVRLAHQQGICVTPLIGPSSILMALMASGLNGQNFAFNGYLPVKQAERVAKIRFFEKRVIMENQTQAFIEAPYRNMQLLEDLLNTCAPSTMLSLAVDISLETEFIKTGTIESWKKNIPQIHKRPAIFIIGK
jgi:16S rRNA (cytidine1402-2'-O)-methyltransferase